jgi:hypothetical protein
LDAALKKTKLDWNPIKIEEIAQHCNDRKLAAKAVSDKSAEMFLGNLLKGIIIWFVRKDGRVFPLLLFFSNTLFIT